MTLGAGNIAVRDIKGEAGTVVIELDGLPCRRNVAGRAVFPILPFGELATMPVRRSVTNRAFSGGVREDRDHLCRDTDFASGRAVAKDTLHFRMASVQPELRNRVVERANVMPGRRGMTCVATLLYPI